LSNPLVQSPRLVMLIADVMTVCLQLRQQLELEDRCLWPRARAPSGACRCAP